MFEFIGNIIMFVPNLIMGLIAIIWHIGVSIISLPINFIFGIVKFFLTPITAIFLFLSPGNINADTSKFPSIQAQDSSSISHVKREYFMNIEDNIRDALNYNSVVSKKNNQIIASIRDERRITQDIYERNIKKVCNYFDEDYSQLRGIKEIDVLNTFSHQGYVLERPEYSCKEINRSSSELLAHTHLY